MENKYRILLVEDEPKLNKVIRDELVRNGYETDAAFDGLIAEKMFAQQKYSLILLDVNIPLKNGVLLCQAFRAQNKKIPIIMLTAYGELQDKIDAFNMGADDYLVKPFHFDELFARIKVFLNRNEPLQTNNEKILIGDMEIDLDNKMVIRQGKTIALTSKEFSLLILLCNNKGRVTPKNEILQKVWGLDFDPGTNTIEVYISFLRNKIDKPFNSKLIHTKAGFGYYIREEPLT